MIARILWPLLLLLIASALIPAGAAETKHGSEPVWVDPGWRRTLARYAITFDEQGMSTTVFDFEIQALDQKGVEAISQQVVGYFEELVASDLATVKADGRAIAADERTIHDEPASTDVASPYFDEQRNKIIAYPDVAVGDKVRGRVRRAPIGRRRRRATAARRWALSECREAPSRSIRAVERTTPDRRGADSESRRPKLF
jgi:hypothetical protein